MGCPRRGSPGASSGQASGPFPLARLLGARWAERAGPNPACCSRGRAGAGARLANAPAGGQPQVGFPVKSYRMVRARVARGGYPGTTRGACMKKGPGQTPGFKFGGEGPCARRVARVTTERPGPWPPGPPQSAPAGPRGSSAAQGRLGGPDLIDHVGRSPGAEEPPAAVARPACGSGTGGMSVGPRGRRSRRGMPVAANLGLQPTPGACLCLLRFCRPLTLTTGNTGRARIAGTHMESHQGPLRCLVGAQLSEYSGIHSNLPFTLQLD